MGETSEILKVFRGSRILVTGGTGFMGQMLMEKLLRSCQIEKLYMLTRPKKDLTEKERLDKILESHLFENLKSQQSQQDLLSKIVLVSGNLEERGLGLKEEDRAMLIREVDLIFHSAATVRFDAKLWTAVAINVLATKDLMNMAREMPQLKAFVHISTAYAFCPRKEIGEEIYQPPIGWREVIQLVNSLDHNTIETITPVVLGEWPNTYSFTKALAESMIKEECKGLPLGIIRPSIVTSTAREPVVCWINNLYGAVGVVAGAAQGLLRSMYCNPEIIADIVPVDMCINAAIAVAWDLSKTRSEDKQLETNNSEVISTNIKNKDEIKIFNYVSSNENPIVWSEFMRHNEIGIRYPSKYCIWYYCFCLNKHRSIHNLYIIFLHYLPAFFVDLGARILGKKPLLWNGYQKIHRFTDVIAYFSTQQWVFHTENTKDLWKRLNSKDRGLFLFDIKTLDWELYLFSMIKGMKFYLLKDDMNDSANGSKIRYRRLKYLHYTLVYTGNVIATYFTIKTVYYILMSWWDFILEELK